jgi:hypothetical protein
MHIKAAHATLRLQRERYTMHKMHNDARDAHMQATMYDDAQDAW